MDKSVIFAVAGAGKTSHLVNQLDAEKRFLIITYTEANYENLRRRVLLQFGYMPPNIKIYTYFSFLHSFCYKPFLRAEKQTKGITFKLPAPFPRYALADDRRFISPSRRVYSNRLAKFIEQSKLMGDVIARVEKYFDVLFVDEVQDFSGHDFNFLIAISKAQLRITFVGDFFQHTFDTSLDGNVNSNLHSDYTSYKARFKNANLNVDTESLIKSYRCSKSVCDFITDKIGISIESHDGRETVVSYQDDADEVTRIFKDTDTVKLFLKEHHKYDCHSHNWGASKGIDRYQDVCVVLNPANVRAWQAGDFRNINAQTRNKLYVACSRARGSLTFVPESSLKSYKRR
ncbi:AAA family ATPase [Ochrobactrum chromiisoli]|uniref:AAA family ATPase n=1 Tax=Ochrobactrum chromiisoli TaxID=2993941 RepID=A0ABT3QKL3_9HYPH|nr:AAA family ATPase [Ochrobactrum chromiisoli]MCX2696158.1 AAA family ATPase [Ochrobactrum chromiisoli]